MKFFAFITTGNGMEAVTTRESFDAETPDIAKQKAQMLANVFMHERNQKTSVVGDIWGADLPAWSARCDCYSGHNSASGRCRVTNVTDLTRYRHENAICEYCRKHCAAGNGTRNPN